MNTKNYPSKPMKDINPAWESEIKKQWYDQIAGTKDKIYLDK